MDKAVILMVEDNDNVLTLNRTVLEGAGYEVRTATTLAAARRSLQGDGPVDLVLLDIELPDGSGFEIVQDIRAAGDAAILMLTSRRKYQDILDGLTGGADDYMTKPYRNEELLARVMALLQKKQSKDSKDNRADARFLSWGKLTLDTVSSQAFVGGTNLQLTPKEYALLALLAQHEGTPLSAERLYEEAWDPKNQHQDARTVKAHISNIRKKLHGSGMTIATEWGEGYVFLQEERH